MKTLIALLLLVCISVYAAEDIEKHYWDCDYASTTSMLGQSDAATCSQIFELLKKEKFQDNWANFYNWWKANKDREYAKRSSKTR